MALTKADMAETLFHELGLNKREAKELVDLFFEEIRAALEDGEQVKLSGFGNFDLRDKNQRPGRNPKTATNSKTCSSSSSANRSFVGATLLVSRFVGIIHHQSGRSAAW